MKLVRNPYAWNQRANVLYVEFGAGIGYSYCQNSTARTRRGCTQESETCSPCLSTDSLVAENNVRFLAGFLELFPELKGRPLFLTGESYAGVYGPTLAQAIVEHFKDTSVANLHGMWITDPCIDNKAQSGWLDLGPEFLFQSGLIDAPVHAALTATDSPCVKGRTAVGDRVRGTDTGECRRAWRLYDMAVAGVGDAVHAEAIPFLPCTSTRSTPSAQWRPEPAFRAAARSCPARTRPRTRCTTSRSATTAMTGTPTSTRSTTPTR